MRRLAADPGTAASHLFWFPLNSERRNSQSSIGARECWRTPVPRVLQQLITANDLTVKKKTVTVTFFFFISLICAMFLPAVRGTHGGEERKKNKNISDYEKVRHRSEVRGQHLTPVAMTAVFTMNFCWGSSDIHRNRTGVVSSLWLQWLHLLVEDGTDRRRLSEHPSIHSVGDLPSTTHRTTHLNYSNAPWEL